jgi:hypothetical protein
MVNNVDNNDKFHEASWVVSEDIKNFRETRNLLSNQTKERNELMSGSKTEETSWKIYFTGSNLNNHVTDNLKIDMQEPKAEKNELCEVKKQPEKPR